MNHELQTEANATPRGGARAGVPEGRRAGPAEATKPSGCRKFGRIDRRFEAIDRRFEAIDRRFVKLEVGLEGVRDEVRVLAEGIAGTNQRLDRFQERLEHLEAG
jgi:hypothetical protein